jgi:molybdenum-dependent DNA-binding transcriptional regulator ModE
MGGSISAAAEDLETSRRQIRNALASARPFLEEAGVDAG